MCLIFLSAMFFLIKFFEISCFEWDHMTVTAGDYTVELEITSDQFKRFSEDSEANPEGSVPAVSFKIYLLSKIKQIIKEDVQASPAAYQVLTERYCL
jgi:hypothetical protein